MDTKSFRLDINSLRALAVVFVILFHFDIAGFSGGFIGVDVFFVISGYLMTLLILKRQVTGSFSLRSFYAARARRIVPALAVLCLCLLLAGFWLLIPLDYYTLSRHAFSSLVFTSNFTFAQKLDYFEAAPLSSWLLHTWSLSVEWQFYLLFPFLILSLSAFQGGRFLKSGFLITLALSLFGSIVWAQIHPTQAFYLLPTRVWEFLAGGAIILFPQAFKANTALIGFIFIAIAACTYTGSMNYPSGWALLPVIGSVLIIASQPRHFLLDNKIVQFLGIISYSLYLWHWPVMTAAHYLGQPITGPVIILMLGITLALSCLSYFCIEVPFRKTSANTSSKKTLVKYALSILALSCLANIVILTKGLPARLPQSVQAAAAARAPANARQAECMYKGDSTFPACILGLEHMPPTAALWGDSHADALFPAFQTALVATKRSGLFFAYSACAPALDAVSRPQRRNLGRTWSPQNCAEFNDNTFARLIDDKNIKDIFIVASWPGYLEEDTEIFTNPHTTGSTGEPALAEYRAHVAKTLCALARERKNVYVLLDVPPMPANVPNTLAKKRLLRQTEDDLHITLATYHQKRHAEDHLLNGAKQKCDITILSPEPYLCDNDVCHGLNQGRPIYSDDNHLNAAGAGLLAPLFTQELKKP